MALKKILKKYMKNFFALKDNTLNKKLQQIIENKKFKTETAADHDINVLSNDLLVFYS